MADELTVDRRLETTTQWRGVLCFGLVLAGAARVGQAGDQEPRRFLQERGEQENSLEALISWLPACDLLISSLLRDLLIS